MPPQVSLDPSTDKLYIKGLESYVAIADEDDAEVIVFTVKQFQRDAETHGGNSFLIDLEDRLSNSIRLTDRITMTVKDFPDALNRLFNEFFPETKQLFHALIIQNLARRVLVDDDEVREGPSANTNNAWRSPGQIDRCR